MGIRDGRLRKWLLSIAVYLRSHNSGLLDAIGQWRANLEQEFAGVEPCLIWCDWLLTLLLAAASIAAAPAQKTAQAWY